VRSKDGIEIPDDIGRMILMHMYKADEVSHSCYACISTYSHTAHFENESLPTYLFSEMRSAVTSTLIAVCLAILTY
jgi:hypothetical protein